MPLAEHGVFPHHGSVVSNKKSINKQLNQPSHLQSRLQVQQDISTPNKRRLNDGNKLIGPANIDKIVRK